MWKIKTDKSTIIVENIPEFYGWKDVYSIEGHLVPNSLLSLLYTKVE